MKVLLPSILGITCESQLSPFVTLQNSVSLQVSGLSHMKFGAKPELRSVIKDEAFVPAGTTLLQSFFPG
jgi:hypothetical protein